MRPWPRRDRPLGAVLPRSPVDQRDSPPARVAEPFPRLLAMSSSRTPDILRVPVDPDGAHYASAFAAPATGSPRTPEHWARATFEDAPAALRWLLRAGWLGVLRLRLGPRSSSEHVLGWPVAEPEPGTIVLAAHSPLLVARNVVSVSGSGLVWATFVRFEGRAGRAVWAATAPMHHRIIPFLLRRAIQRSP